MVICDIKLKALRMSTCSMIYFLHKILIEKCDS
jgi:hypothetical protein